MPEPTDDLQGQILDRKAIRSLPQRYAHACWRPGRLRRPFAEDSASRSRARASPVSSWAAGGCANMVEAFAHCKPRRSFTTTCSTWPTRRTPPGTPTSRSSTAPRTTSGTPSPTTATSTSRSAPPGNGGADTPRSSGAREAFVRSSAIGADPPGRRRGGSGRAPAD